MKARVTAGSSEPREPRSRGPDLDGGRGVFAVEQATTMTDNVMDRKRETSVRFPGNAKGSDNLSAADFRRSTVKNLAADNADRQQRDVHHGHHRPVGDHQ